MRGDLLALGAMGALAIVGATKSGARNDPSGKAAKEARNHIREALSRNARLVTRDWTNISGVPPVLAVEWDKDAKLCVGDHDFGTLLMLEIYKTLKPLGFLSEEEDRPEIFTNLGRIKVRAGPALLWIWCGVHRPRHNTRATLNLQSPQSVFLLGGDASPWALAKREESLTFWKKGSRANKQDVPALLRQVTSDMLKQMLADEGWTSLAQEAQLDPNAPCAWDVNCGWCEDWARAASRKLGVVGSHYENVFWLDEFDKKYEDVAHAVLRLDGRFYDAQHPEGVARLKDLDLVKGVSREKWIKKEARGTRAW